MEVKLFLSNLGLNLSEDFRLAVLASEWHDILKLLSSPELQLMPVVSSSKI